MIKFADIIPGGPWAQEEVVQEQSNPAISGYGTLSPCRSTGPLYQQVLTPQVPPETEMDTWLELLTDLAESSEKGELTADFIHQLVTSVFHDCISECIQADQSDAIYFLFHYISEILNLFIILLKDTMDAQPFH